MSRKEKGGILTDNVLTASLIVAAVVFVICGSLAYLTATTQIALLEAKKELSNKDRIIEQLQEDLALQQEQLDALEKEFIKQENLLRENVQLRETINKVSRGGTRPRNFSLKKDMSTWNEQKLSYAGLFNVTFYTPCKEECGSNNGITAAGEAVSPAYSAAVDTRLIPFGTKLYIEGWGIVEAHDTGSNIRGNHIDICIFDKTMAKKLGRLKNRKVWVVDVQ